MNNLSEIIKAPIKYDKLYKIKGKCGHFIIPIPEIENYICKGCGSISCYSDMAINNSICDCCAPFVLWCHIKCPTNYICINCGALCCFHCVYLDEINYALYCERCWER